MAGFRTRRNHVSINAALTALCQRRKCAAARHSLMFMGIVLPTTITRSHAIRRAEAKAALEAKDAEANAKAEEIEALKAKTEALGEASPQSGEQAHCCQGGAV